MRGFVITILSVSFMVMLILLALSLHNIQLSTERVLMEPVPLTYAAFLLDDVAYEFNSLVGPRMAFNETNDSVKVTVIDSLHTYNHSADMAAYEAFLEGDVADSTSSSITANFTNLTGGTMKLFIDEDYVYTNNYADTEAIFTRSGGTGATAYGINLTITEFRQNVTPMTFNDSGTLNVTICYTDLNGTDCDDGKVFPNQANTMVLNYANGSSVTVTVGPQSGNSGSLRLKATGIRAETAWSVELPRLNATKKMGYEYDATIAYVQGSVSKRCRIGR